MGQNDGGGELAAGGVLGLLAVGEAALGAAVCPPCIVGAPALIGLGLIKRVKSKKG